jgi:hypothetical protein
MRDPAKCASQARHSRLKGPRKPCVIRHSVPVHPLADNINPVDRIFACRPQRPFPQNRWFLPKTLNIDHSSFSWQQFMDVILACLPAHKILLEASIYSYLRMPLFHATACCGNPDLRASNAIFRLTVKNRET